MSVNTNCSEKNFLSKVTVIHIAPTPFFANRGCHIRILNEIKGLQQNNIEVVLCTYGIGNDIEGIDIKRISRIPGYTKTTAGFSPYKFIADILLFFLVLKVVFNEKTCVLHGHLHEGGLIGSCVKLLLFWKKIYVVMDVQGSLSGELKAYGTFRRFPLLLKVFYFVERIISLMPDKIICSSSASKEFITDVCGVSGSRVGLLEDVVPDQIFDERDATQQKILLGVPLDKKVVIYTGSLLQGKGVDILVQSIKSILSKRDDLFFIMIGYPKDWIEEFFLQNGLQENLIIPGEIPYQNLGDWLSTADLAIDPKTSVSGEASGKILHYMAAGICITCFKTDNNIKFLGEHCYYASTETQEGLADAIEYAFEKGNSRYIYATAGRKKVKNECSLFSAGEKLCGVYVSLIQ